MEASYQVLDQLYKKMLLGAPLESDSQEYAFYLNLPFSAQDLSTSNFLKWPCVHHGNQATSVNMDGISTPSTSINLKMNFQVSNPRDIMLLQLTVIKMMITKILSKKLEFSIQEKYCDIIEILLKPYELESKLISTFHSSDKLLSHMAAKCLASLLYLQLREKAVVNKTWTAFCLKTLSDYPESNTVSYCLWILTAVIKEILKTTCLQKAEILKQFLTSFDFLFEVFYCSVFSQHFENYEDTSLNPKITNFLICFLELLEILMASRIHLKLYLTCQRIFYLKIFCALDIITWPIHSLVKKKFIILIKRCLLHKVGEDVLNTSLPTLTEQDPYLDMDMLALGNAFLQAVNLGWLKQLSISAKPSHFGGNEVQPGNKSGVVPDLIIIRASSLVLLKSLEIKVHNCMSANEVKAELQKFMSELLTFLKQHLHSSLKLHHHCEWLSKIFIEQDDDMLEAAKASLSIYLKLTRAWNEAAKGMTQEKETWDHQTHENGFNPHCIFLFLLKNIGFDATVLLDFLISSETCFLEYFVRYLKLLQGERNNFSNVCELFDTAELRDEVYASSIVTSLVEERSSNQATHQPLFCGTNYYALLPLASDTTTSGTNMERKDNQTVKSKQPSVLIGVDDTSSSGASQSLVDYDGSEDSEEESVEECLSNIKQTPLNHQVITKIRGTVSATGGKSQKYLASAARLLDPKEFSALSSFGCVGASQTVLSCKALKCLKDLEKAISRLHRRHLFPYNPSALLKLLKHIDATNRNK
ncbi:protein Lines homolog 1 isoform X1 [Phascolarctos cinereus]|uniref:Protein Lines homolog 1 isoform X1 n=1 Tax=Phascolarctos cinereus TaxID=38626 RepID=A0A6P5IKS1_PHACI|nr:protein Lines homolog 1 isoform X1 [Phascolarctos cinereus]XP_020819442.1 protein Lines homolog 1 isoform X1 [Phascolarctos cinereus]XP_020819451.1 protein Lines homolog 1 isoform X1 [Phascolarctos cinereus]XP_020819460.1 protein Lines homolog 1 isoform X1 [Phascolarctos cinereus]XP_020819468.1 protein Lines homolog 1 isoform X1 [Phascolarctos cinereus]XP_020819473.1 protein Lines homolog 1 isoform X1 [Phascolarctos cinereus]